MSDSGTSIPEKYLDLFQEPALGHTSWLNDKGQIVTFPLWVDYDGEHVIATSPVGSKKGHSFRERPAVAVSIVSTKDPWHWLSVSGRVVEIVPDTDLAYIDKLSQRYTGAPYQRRTPREIFRISIDRLSHSW